MAFTPHGVNPAHFAGAAPFNSYQGHNDERSIARILLDNFQALDKLRIEGKVRKTALDEAAKAIPCHFHKLGRHCFECPVCHRTTFVYNTCHGRLCTSCGAKAQRLLAASASAICVDCDHRHIVFTIPEEYRVLSRIDRALLNLMYIAARNTICILANPKKYEKLLKKARKTGKSVYDCNGGVYLFANDPTARVPGMIACLHTFGRDLKRNPHIHACVAEMLWDPGKERHRPFQHIDFKGLRMHWQRKLNELMTLHFGSAPVSVDGMFIAQFGKSNPTYGRHPNGYYVYAAYGARIEPEDFQGGNGGKRTERGKDEQGSTAQCISYIIRYSSRPAISEGRITSYDKTAGTVTYYYDDHADGQRKPVTMGSLDFCRQVLLHIPDKGFKMVRHYGFYHQKCTAKLDMLNESLGKTGRRKRNRFQRSAARAAGRGNASYRPLCIRVFGRDPLKCKCGTEMERVFSDIPKNTMATRERRVYAIINEGREREFRAMQPRREQQTLFGERARC